MSNSTQPQTATDRHASASLITQEIATVVREIRDLVAVPWAERDEDWRARCVVLEARKAALVAACEDIATARTTPEPGRLPRVAADPRRPADVREVQR